MSAIEELRQIINNAENIVFFGGAGVSTDSGIPDFRGNGGLYTELDGIHEDPEVILSNYYITKEPAKFFAYYRKNLLYPDAQPNGAHKALAELERRGKLTAVITQNIDGLHQLAGSKRVIELHGSSLRNYCTRCRKTYSMEHILCADGIPFCELCGGTVRPDVVLYGEGLDRNALSSAVEAVCDADVMIVAGSSLRVNPAASLVGMFGGEHLIIINKTETPYDGYAEYVIRDSIADVLTEIVC